MAPTTVHDYYAILEIPQSADSATIKLTYKGLALAKHPDRRRNEPNATAEFQLIPTSKLYWQLSKRALSLIRL